MRNESAPSISSRSAVSYSKLAIALFSMEEISLNKVGGKREVRRNRGAQRQRYHCAGWDGARHGSPVEGGKTKPERRLRCLSYVGGLRSFLALHNLELDLVSFLQTLVAIG